MQPAAELRLSEVVSALSYALDITEGQPEGHAVRSCLIGMRLAESLPLSSDDRSALFYALMLKDLGCSSNAAKVCDLFGADDRSVKVGLKTVDWTSMAAASGYVLRAAAPQGNPLQRLGRILAIALAGPGGTRQMFRTRCERGADIAAMLGLPPAASSAIRTLDEHWDGRGQPAGLKRDRIPMLGRILCLAQTVEVFERSQGREAALDMARRRKGRWFDPALVDRLSHLGEDPAFWPPVDVELARALVGSFEPPDRHLHATQARLEQVAGAFARVVDAKSPWTFRHSERVAEIACGVGARLGMHERDLHTLKLSALLHDIGKLGISNRILDKAGPLTAEERLQIQRHVEHTQSILGRVGSFQRIAEIAGSHHERVDGAGYWRGLSGAELSRSVRVLVIADYCEALLAERPYRRALPPAEALAILRREVGTALCPEAFAALESYLA